MIALDDKFIWDSWYVKDGELWHAFFLQAPRSIGDPDLRHWNVSYGHGTSTDLSNWTHLGTCFFPSEGDGWDNYTTWTGSVVEGDDGLWHLFYTGSNQAEDGLYQRIGHATSTDLHNWKRVGDGQILDLVGPNAVYYEDNMDVSVWHDRAMRDPWVMRDPDGDGWLMYFTARARGISEPNAGGCIGLATSPDIFHWTLQPPVFTGGFGQLEVPQVFEIEDRWYCLFCTSAEHFSAAQARRTPGGPVTGNHYLMADTPRGPWRIAPGFFDGALPPNRYAARILDTDDGLVISGFADRPNGGDFKGHIMDYEKVIVTAEGLLRIETRKEATE
ncbi:MAG: levansucrase [Pseudomonadota bacterium]